MQTVNLWAVIVAAIVAFLFGWLWYSQAVLGKVCARVCGKDPAQYKNKKHGAMIYVVSLIYMFVSAYAFAAYLDPYGDLSSAVKFGLVIGICWVGTAFGMNYLFSGRPFKLFLIDAGYYVGQFVLYGLIIGWWR